MIELEASPALVRQAELGEGRPLDARIRMEDPEKVTPEPVGRATIAFHMSRSELHDLGRALQLLAGEAPALVVAGDRGVEVVKRED